MSHLFSLLTSSEIWKWPFNYNHEIYKIQKQRKLLWPLIHFLLLNSFGISHCAWHTHRMTKFLKLEIKTTNSRYHPHFSRVTFPSPSCPLPNLKYSPSSRPRHPPHSCRVMIPLSFRSHFSRKGPVQCSNGFSGAVMDNSSSFVIVLPQEDNNTVRSYVGGTIRSFRLVCLAIDAVVGSDGCYTQ